MIPNCAPECHPHVITEYWLRVSFAKKDAWCAVIKRLYGICCTCAAKRARKSFAPSHNAMWCQPPPKPQNARRRWSSAVNLRLWRKSKSDNFWKSFAPPHYAMVSGILPQTILEVASALWIWDRGAKRMATRLCVCIAIMVHGAMCRSSHSSELLYQRQ